MLRRQDVCERCCKDVKIELMDNSKIEHSYKKYMACLMKMLEYEKGGNDFEPPEHCPYKLEHLMAVDDE